MLVAPRALNEPVSCRFSAFSPTRAPTRRESSPAGSIGVSRTLPAIARRGLDILRAHGFRSDCHTALSAHGQTGRRPFGCSRARRCSRVWSPASSRRWRRWPSRAAGTAARHLPGGGLRRHLLPAPLGRGRAHPRAPGRAHGRPGGAARGALFGELAMFRGETRSATAEAIEPSTAVALLAGDVQRLVQRKPGLALKLLARWPSGSAARTSACSSSRSRPSLGGWRARCSPRPWRARPRARPRRTC